MVLVEGVQNLHRNIRRAAMMRILRISLIYLVHYSCFRRFSLLEFHLILLDNPVGMRGRRNDLHNLPLGGVLVIDRHLVAVDLSALLIRIVILSHINETIILNRCGMILLF